MTRLLKQVTGNEQGQALPIVLVLLLLGGLVITPSLNYAATSLNHGRVIDKGIAGIYAAEAGVEEALWYLTDNSSPVQQLTEKINQMDVTIETEEKGAYTIYFGEVVQAGNHHQNLSVDGDMVWDGDAEAWEYTITVTWQGGTSIIHVTEVGVKLPLGYSYQSGSAATFANNLSAAEPDEALSPTGAHMLNWEFMSPYPSVSESDPERTQTFYITGEGSHEGDYSWVVANRTDIGEVGEMSGSLYVVRATAVKPENGEITATIVADILMDDGIAYIVSWQVLR